MKSYFDQLNGQPILIDYELDGYKPIVNGVYRIIEDQILDITEFVTVLEMDSIYDRLCSHVSEEIFVEQAEMINRLRDESQVRASTRGSTCFLLSGGV